MNSEKHLQKITCRIWLKSCVTCNVYFRGFNVTTPHTSVTGHNSNIIYVTELKNTPQGACTQLKTPITLFPLDLFLVLWYFGPLHDVNFAINLTLAKKFIGRFITYFRILTFPKSICDKTMAKKCWSLSKIPFLDVETAFRHTLPSSG